MKRFIIGVMSCVVVLTSFASCFSFPSSTVPSIHWSLGVFNDEWGDRTSDYYTSYDGQVDALFSNSAVSSRSAPISELMFSKVEGLAFHIPTATGMSPLSASDAEITIKLSNGEEKVFQGRALGPKGGPNVFFPYSEELLNALRDEKPRIRFSSQGIRYQFDLPAHFTEAYERLEIRQSGN